MLTKVSTGTSQPTSVTVKPAALSMLQTIVLPISWMSPATVPATATPSERLAPPAASRAGCKDGDRGLHRLGPLDELGEEELAAGEEVADLLDALDEAQVEDVDRGKAGVEALLGELGRELGLAVDHGLLHLGVQILGHRFLLAQLSSAARALTAGPARRRVCPSVPNGPDWSRRRPVLATGYRKRVWAGKHARPRDPARASAGREDGRGPAAAGPRPPGRGTAGGAAQRTSETLALSSRKTMMIMLKPIMKVEIALISGVMPMRTIDQIFTGSVL